MANEHIKNYLNWYLSDSCNNPKMAVLIKGGWGSGKTFFMKQFIRDQEAIEVSLAASSTKSFLYVSLYGLSAASDIDDQIFEQLHPILASKGVAIAGKIAKGLLRFGLKINLDSDGTAEASASPTIPDVSIKSFLAKFKNKYLVFDDLERCEMDVQHVLGYINAFVEHQDTKVIIIANDDELEEGLSPTEKSADSKYHRIKEKVIGKTFLIEADNEQVMTSIIQECCQQARAFLMRQQALCLDIFNAVETVTRQRNFRAFSHSLRDLEYLWPTIEPRFTSHLDLMTHFANIFLRLSYELQLSNIRDEDILKIDSWQVGTLLKKTRNASTSQFSEDPKNDRLGAFFSRHKPLHPYNMSIMPPELWHKLICQCSNISAQLNQAFASSQFFVDERTPEWQKLWHHMTSEDDKVPNLIIQVAKSVSDHEYVHPGVVLHIFGLFMWLSDLGYSLPPEIGSSLRAILRTGKSYIDWLDANKKLPDDISVFSSVDMSTGYFGLAFASNDKPEFIAFREYYETKSTISRRRVLIAGAPNVLELMHQNPLDFYQTIGNPHLRGSPLWNVPVFASINPQDFVSHFLQVSNGSKMDILEAISERYKWLNNSDTSLKTQMKDLAKEYTFWVNLKKRLSSDLKHKQMAPSIVWARRLNDEAVSNAIRELGTFRSSLVKKPAAQVATAKLRRPVAAKQQRSK